MLTIVVIKSKRTGRYFAIKRHNDFNINAEGIIFLLKQKELEPEKAFERRVLEEAKRRHIFHIEGFQNIY